MEKYEYSKIKKKENNEMESVDYWFELAMPKKFYSYSFNYGKENYYLTAIA